MRKEITDAEIVAAAKAIFARNIGGGPRPILWDSLSITGRWAFIEFAYHALKAAREQRS